MAIARSVDAVTPQSFAYPTGSYTVADYFGESQGARRGPQAYLTTTEIEGEGHAHFHVVDQFQVVVGGQAVFGKTPADPVSVHYVDGFTPYALHSGPEGLSFFSLRPRADQGAHNMPESRGEMLRPAGRHRLAGCGVARVDDAGSPSIAFLIDPEVDGLYAFSTIAGPDRDLPDDIAGGSGRYDLVLAGIMELDGQLLAPRSLVWTDAGERLPRRRAGADGVQVLSVQAPRA